jgi:hypothetical protein
MPLNWTLKEWLRTHYGLTDPKDIRDSIQNQTRYKIPLRSIRSLLKKRPKTLDTKILLAICDVFRCHLSNFCAVKPAPKPPISRTNVNIQHLLQPCAIGANETLNAFLVRVQMVAISEALLMTDNNFSHACQLLGASRGQLHSFYRREVMKSPPEKKRPMKTRPRKLVKAIPLPTAIFIVGKHEDFQSFKHRITLAATIRTIKLEGNHTRAALRLGCHRTTILRMLKRATDPILET